MEKRLESFDVCIVCALAEEAQAFLRIVKEHCHAVWSDEVSPVYGLYQLTAITNVNGETLSVHISCPSRFGSDPMTAHLVQVIKQAQPRFVIMTGICAGDHRRTKLGDLIVAERTFKYDLGKMKKDRHGPIIHDRTTITYQLPEHVHKFVNFFEHWKAGVASLPRPLSKRQQREWLLQRLCSEPTTSVKALPQRELDQHAPNWRQIISELQQGQEPYLSPFPELSLRDKKMIECLRYGPESFPFQDPREAQCHIKTLASGSAVRADDPFKDIQIPVREAIALDLEGAALGSVMAMEEFRQIDWLIVKAVSDYADRDKDDSYHTYAATASAIYALSFIQAYVTNERLSRPQRSFSKKNTHRLRDLFALGSAVGRNMGLTHSR